MKELIKSILQASPIPLTKNLLYDKQTKQIISTVLSSNSNCIDVGCHKGEILDLMLKAAPNGQHFGFEPIPMLYQKLFDKYEKFPNCKIYEVAASNEKSNEISFNYVISNPSYSGLVKRAYDKPNEEDQQIQVATDLLDNIIDLNLKIDLIKIDVEGGELLVLEGAKNIVQKHQPHIIFEHGLGASEFYDSSPEKIWEYFSAFEMKIATLSQFLKKSTSLSFEAFCEQFYERKNYYFIAYP